MKNNKAITLIALVITIVVLIILAAVAINLSLGNNGIFNRAKTAKEQYQNAQDYEETEIAKATNEIDTLSRGGNISTYTETIIWEGQSSVNDVITFKDGHTVDEFDKIKFLHGFVRNGGWDWLFPIEYSINDWNYAMQSQSTNNCIIGLAGYYDNHVTLYNITKTGFTVGQQNGPSILRIYGIKY